MFDVPVRTKVQRRKYAQFRTHLLSDGFIQLQYSVYAKYFGSEKKSESTLRATVGKIPEEGYVRILKVTDHQFGKMENYFGDTLKGTLRYRVKLDAWDLQ
ncbi:MAG: CRISPR-associated endonuclease Cas2, partial [Planctomycetota bacterium]